MQFSVWAPRARAPRLRIGGGVSEVSGDHPLTASTAEPGIWSVTLPNVGVGVDYGFIFGDDRLLPDPVSRWQPHGVHGASRVVDPASFQWTDDGWRGVPLAELVIYELHVGTFTHEGAFDAVIPRLPELASLGVSAIEIMPVAQFPGSRNWGYDGVGLYAVQNTYGGPDALKRLVNAAHAAGLGVILDVVYNHVGPEGNYLDAFGPYFTEKYKTPWGRALNYDDAHSDEVRHFIIDNTRYWITEYHVDGLRLDAVHGIFDFSARHLLEEIATAAHEQGKLLGRTVVVIGESDLNDPKLLRPVAEHGYGLDAQWSDDFHHAVHAALTEERTGYYVDYGPVSVVADAMREPFVFAGQHSASRKRRHGAPSCGIPRRRFVVAIQNHDQVGNRAIGDRLASLVPHERVRLAAALLLLSPYVPLLFMGEEYGETNPFLYFVSHSDPQLLGAIRDGRREEFAAFGWADDVPDVADETTFAQSKLEWSRALTGRHAQLRALYRDLLALRRDEPMLRPDGSVHSIEHGAPGWITILREPSDMHARPGPYVDDGMLCLFNCCGEPCDVPVPAANDRAWTMRLSTESPSYGGRGEIVGTIDAAPCREDGPRRLLAVDAPRAVHMPAWSAALFTTV